ncbi:hypothetical protein H5410_014547 [Solanum commersonii]|uniref:Uncharacterized protein n=1 Tax=Solanum commersonii TaxID=4109 RepID=A0A9J5ZRJ5_SOLCO|nr:hypothetical protein H5410_014547 [Solanum commersonii]
MSNLVSSSKVPLSHEVENLSSFDFYIPTPEESPSTPVYGVSEMAKSFTHQTGVVASLVLLSFDDVLNSEVQYVAKLGVELHFEEMEVGFMAISSTISERIFEGDLVPHRSEPIFDQTPKYFNVGNDKEEVEEVPLRWNSRGMRGGNQSQVNVPELETVKSKSEIDIVGKSAKREKERQRKGKTKLVLSHSKRDKMKYVTRSETQKIMVSAIVASKAQTERTRKRRREGLNLNNLPLLPCLLGLVKLGQMTLLHTLLKGEKKQRKKGEEKEMTKVERIEKMEHQKVLNRRVFYSGILTKPGMANLFYAVSIQGWNHLFVPLAPYLHEPEVCEFYYKMELLERGGITTTVKDVKIRLDEETLGIILGVPKEGIRTIEGYNSSNSFTKCATKRGDVRQRAAKKFLKEVICSFDV